MPVCPESTIETSREHSLEFEGVPVINRSSASLGMEEELAAVLADPAFARSPVLSRLLTYLVTESIAGRGDRLKSYTVAVDGLGRGDDYDPQVDTYSRVLVGRLRKALDTFYREAGAHRAQRLTIGQGAYEVRIEQHDEPASMAIAPPPAAHAPAGRKPLHRQWWLFLLITVGALVIGYLVWQDRQESAKRWRASNRPAIMITVESASPQGTTNAEQAIAEKIGDVIRGYESFRLAHQMNPGVNYVLNLSFRQARNGSTIDVDVANISRNRQIFSQQMSVTGSAELTDQELWQIRRLVYSLIGNSGSMTALESRYSFSANTPFDCWLRFNRLVVADGVTNDPVFEWCSAQWYKHSPEHPLAAALYGWSLTSKAIGSPISSRLRQDLRSAMQILESARTKNPRSRHLLLALARTYAVMGYADSLRAVAKDSTEAARDNPDVAATIGMLRVLQDDLSGEVQIDEAIALNPNPPPRYFIGKFISAMMRDDVAAAGQALDKLTTENHTSRWGPVFRAAYLARSGNIPAAKAAWRDATVQFPLARHFPRAIVSNAPASNAVKDRLMQWLKPATE
jgi:adenylate cyclase